MTSAMLTRLLAEQVMGWRAGSGRFLLGAREWITENQFQPLTRIEHAFKLLRKLACEYALMRAADGTFTARVDVGQHSGHATCQSEPMAVALAIARAIGIDVRGVD